MKHFKKVCIFYIKFQLKELLLFNSHFYNCFFCIIYIIYDPFVIPEFFAKHRNDSFQVIKNELNKK